MATQVIMPKFGMAQEDATILRWLKREGDVVEKGDVLLEVQTDKVNMEVESPGSGILRGTLAQEGQVVPVTQVIAYVLEPDEVLPTSDERGTTVVTPTPASPIKSDRRVTPVAQKILAAAGVDPSSVPSASPEQLTRQDAEKFLAQQRMPNDTQSIRATPAARRLAGEKKIDLTLIPGSGPQGRVQARDVVKTPDAPAPKENVLESESLIDEIIPLQGIRRTIANRMQASSQTAPHITFTVKADMTAAYAWRDEMTALAKVEHAPTVSFTALLVKVCAWALMRHRWVNASLHEDGIHLHRAVNIGVAVARTEGLIVPVIHQADRLNLGDITNRLNDLATRAKSNALTPDDVTGGTFTISNLGMFGIDEFTAIINPPESAILAVGRICKCPRVNEQDQIVARPMMKMTLSADHRVMDGAAAALFLRDVVTALEKPTILLW